MNIRPILSAAPATARLTGRRGGDPELVAEAEVICAAEEFYSPEAICLAEEETLATGTMAGNQLADVLRLGKEGMFPHRPTLAYRLRDVLCANGCYYAGKHWKAIAAGPRYPLIAGMLPSHGEGHLVSDTHFELYFGHWLVDGLALELQTNDVSAPNFALRRLTPRFHEPYYRAATGLAPNVVDSAHFHTLWVYDDRGLNSGKRSRLRELRQRVRQGASDELSGAPVYLTRGKSGTSREIADEGILMDRLARRGFDIVDPVNNKPSEFIHKLLNTPLVISIEGSHQSHAILSMPAGSRMLTIMPQDRFLHSWKFQADVSNTRSGFVVARKENDNYFVDYEKLLRTIDLMA